MVAPNVVRQPRGAALAPDTAFCGARAGRGLSDARVRFVKVDHLSFPPPGIRLILCNSGGAGENAGWHGGFGYVITLYEHNSYLMFAALSNVDHPKWSMTRTSCNTPIFLSDGYRHSHGISAAAPLSRRTRSSHFQPFKVSAPTLRLFASAFCLSSRMISSLTDNCSSLSESASSASRWADMEERRM